MRALVGAHAVNFPEGPDDYPDYDVLLDPDASKVSVIPLVSERSSVFFL